MKASRLGLHFQQLIRNMAMDDMEHDEEGLGFDTMLNHDVVTFLRTHHKAAKPLVQRGGYRPDSVLALDEHELAMV